MDYDQLKHWCEDVRTNKQLFPDDAEIQENRERFLVFEAFVRNIINDRGQYVPLQFFAPDCVQKLQSEIVSPQHFELGEYFIKEEDGAIECTVEAMYVEDEADVGEGFDSISVKYYLDITVSRSGLVNGSARVTAFPKPVTQTPPQKSERR